MPPLKFALRGGRRLKLNRAVSLTELLIPKTLAARRDSTAKTPRAPR